MYQFEVFEIIMGYFKDKLNKEKGASFIVKSNDPFFNCGPFGALI